MQAVAFNGPGQNNIEDRPEPVIRWPGDASVKLRRRRNRGADGVGVGARADRLGAGSLFGAVAAPAVRVPSIKGLE